MELLSFLLLSFLHDAQGDQNYEQEQDHPSYIQPFLITNHQNRIPIKTKNRVKNANFFSTKFLILLRENLIRLESSLEGLSGNMCA